MNIKFVSNAKIWIAISLAVIVAGLGYMLVKGLNLGVDFAGGSQIYVNVGQDYTPQDIRSIVSSAGVKADVLKAGANKQDVIIRMRRVDNQEEVHKKIIDGIAEKYGLSPEQFSVDYVGPTIGRELIRNAVTSILIACVLILGYIWVRFELKSGVAAIIALIHDVLVMIAVVALLRVQINSPFVAAMLTIIGYSINDTIIVFDRVRENNKRFGKVMSGDEIVDKSVNETLIRSLNTSMTTLFTLVALYILGVESIKEFALPLLVGVVSGTYSSIFIAGPVWALWDNKANRKKSTVTK